MTDPTPAAEEAEPSSLAGLFAELSAELDAVEIAEIQGGAEYRRGSRPFAVLAGDSAEFRLRPDVATAALRTTDSGASPRGPEWVRFSPRTVDRFALDRAEAWFLSAWRAAGG